MTKSDFEGIEYVDLGLPSGTKWATCNVGASSPWGYGDYYTFDEAQNYNPPSEEQLKELKDKCQWEWVDWKGYKVIGPNGKSICLPAAGWRFSSGRYRGEDGSYWSGSPHESYSDGACSLYFDDSSVDVDWDYRLDGRSVRGVVSE